MYIADPNGPMENGGNMEFLSIPIQKLPDGVDPSVNCSRFDREVLMQKTAVATVKNTTSKKREVELLIQHNNHTTSAVLPTELGNNNCSRFFIGSPISFELTQLPSRTQM